MSLALLRFGYAALTGVDAVVDQVAKQAVRLALGSHRIDDDAGARMVAAIEADAPRDTGRLAGGVETFREGDGLTVVQASAVRISGGQEWDYAPFQEHGTAHDDAEPFFYDNVSEVLAERGQRMSDLAGEASF